MKKIMLFAGIMAIALSCAKEIRPVENQGTDPVDEIQSKLILTAGKQQSDLVKTTLSGVDFLWENTDEVAVYDSTALNKFTVSKISEDGKTATLEGSAAEAKSYVAVAPFSAASLKSKVVSVTIPSQQNITDDRVIDSEAILSVCRFEGTSIALKNEFSLVKFKIETDNVLAVTIVGNNSEKITGTAALAEDLTVGAADQETVTVTYGDEETFPMGEFYAVIYPTTFTKGFRVVLTNFDGEKSYKGLTSEKVFAKNAGMDVKTVDNVTTWIPNTITTFAQLKGFAAISDTYTTANTVKLGADIDCDGAEWKPFNLYCNFDGQNHHVYNFQVTTPARYSGFFALVNAGLSVKNLCIGSSDYDFSTKKGTADGFSKVEYDTNAGTGTWTYCGGVDAYAYPGCVLENLVNFVPVSVKATSKAYQMRIAGVSGTVKGSVTVKNCINFAPVTFTETAATTKGKDICSVGGVTSCIDGKDTQVIGCENYGAISNYNPIVCNVGGVVGFAKYESLISECTNSGDVINYAASESSGAGYGVHLGGVCGGALAAGVTLNKCINNGAVQQAAAAPTNGICIGGILGISSGAVLVKGCKNNSSGLNITAEVVTSPSLGGIVGYINGEGTKITKADDGTYTENAGDFKQGANSEVSTYFGGIAGYVNTDDTGAEIEYCKNTANISQSSEQVEESTAVHYIGGISAITKKCVFRYCTNSGQIQGTCSSANKIYTTVGGIVGQLGNYAGSGIYSCSNSGKIYINHGLNKHMYAGGIAGAFNVTTGTINDCHNSGSIHMGRNGNTYAGGLVGVCYVNTTTTPIDNFTDCSSTSDNIFSETAYGYGNCGGLIGFFASTPKADLNIGTESHPVTFGGTVTIGENKRNHTLDDIFGTAWMTQLDGKKLVVHAQLAK